MSENFAAIVLKAEGNIIKIRKLFSLRSGGGGRRERGSTELPWGHSPQMYCWSDYPSQLLQGSKEILPHVHWSIITHSKALMLTFIWRRRGHSHTLLEVETLLSHSHLALIYYSQAFKISPQCLSQIIYPDANLLLKGNLSWRRRQ